MRLPTALILAATAASLVLGVTACAPRLASEPTSKGTLTVGSKDFAESEILGYLIAERLTSAGFTVRTRIPVGTTREVRAALLDGTVDIYPEYTGTGLTLLTSVKPSMIASGVYTDPDLTYRQVALLDNRDSGVVWLKPAPGNNTFVIALPRAFARANSLRTLTDFAAYVNRGGRVKLIGGKAVLNRPDSIALFESAYGFKLKPEQIQEIAVMESLVGEQAAATGAGGVNAVLGYSTDAGIKANGLLALLDDQKTQNVYQPAPVLLASTNEKHPEIASSLSPVFAKLTTATLRALNARVVVSQEDPEAVARGWLYANGLGK